MGWVAPAAAVASTAMQAAPLLAGQEQAPNTTQMAQVPGAGQTQTPQGLGMATQANIGQQDQLMQLLLALMQSIPMGGQQAPQATPKGVGPQTAGGITPGPSRTGIY